MELGDQHRLHSERSGGGAGDGVAAIRQGRGQDRAGLSEHGPNPVGRLDARRDLVDVATRINQVEESLA